MKEKFYALWTTGRGLYVLLSLLILGIFGAPLLITDGLISDVFIDSIFTLVLIAGIFATPCSAPLRVGMLIITFLGVIARIMHKFNLENFTLAKTDNTLAVITLTAFSLLIIKHFLIDKAALRYRIVAAVALYLIIGVLFARIYEIVYLLNPESFSLDEKINPYSLIYFSFVTITTMGYGDIVPLTIAARSLAILEGVIGQLYMVILISSLVSEFSSLRIKSFER